MFSLRATNLILHFFLHCSCMLLLAGTTGKIYYQEHDTDGMLNVECTLSYESYGEIEDDEE